MTKNKLKSDKSLNASKIKIIGVGGAGISVVKRMLQKNISQVDYIVVDTDEQALDSLDLDGVKKIQIEKNITKGADASLHLDKDKENILKNKEELKKIANKAGIIFIAVGLGGVTGSGIGPVVADICKKSNALTVGVLTKPFNFEGRERLRIANQAIDNFKNKLDAFVLMSNSRIMQIVDRQTSINKAFDVVDEAVRDGISLFTNILNKTGIININLSDIASILKGAGPIFLGSGKVDLQAPAKQAGTKALENPLIEDLVPQKAKNIIFVISGPESLPMSKVDNLANRINKELRTDARIIFGTIIEKNRQNIGVTLIGTEFKERFENGDEKSQNSFSNKRNQKSDFIRKRVRPQKQVKAYGEASPETKEELMENGNFEDELDIPAFLRKKLKK